MLSLLKQSLLRITNGSVKYYDLLNHKLAKKRKGSSELNISVTFRSFTCRKIKGHEEFSQCISFCADPSGCAAWHGSDASCWWGYVFKPRSVHRCVSHVSVVCCQVEIFATVWSLVNRSPTECGVSECDREASRKRKPWPTRDCRKNERTTVLIATGSRTAHNYRIQVRCSLKPACSALWSHFLQ
jgi:hypothetical protein